jgi:ketosteroid isomerase-like protein
MNRTPDRDTRASADQARTAPEQRILSMTPDGQTGDSVKSIVRRRIEAMAQAIRDRDLAQLMTYYAHDVEVFDVRFSINLLGAAAYRNNFEHWFESFEGPIGFEHHNLRIKVDEDVAYRPKSFTGCAGQLLPRVRAADRHVVRRERPERFGDQGW